MVVGASEIISRELSPACTFLICVFSFLFLFSPLLFLSSSSSPSLDFISPVNVATWPWKDVTNNLKLRRAESLFQVIFTSSFKECDAICCSFYLNSPTTSDIKRRACVYVREILGKRI